MTAFPCTRRLVKQYLAWQWRLYGKRCFVRQLVAHVALMVLVTYVAVASKYKLLETGASLHRCGYASVRVPVAIETTARL